MKRRGSELRKKLLILVLISLAGNSCRQHKALGISRDEDSNRIVSLVKEMYKWNEVKNTGMGFEVVVKDTLQTSLDTTKLGAYIASLKSAQLFSVDFISNYKTIVQRTDYKLRNASPKYYNEINFGFQNADPWTFFQEDIDSFPARIQIHNLQIAHDSASLRWTLPESNERAGYLMKFAREKGSWKVSYMQGFDTACCW